MVPVPGQNTGQLAGHAGTAHGNHALNGVFGQHGHNAGLNGNIDARDAAALQKAEEVLVVKKELADQMLGAGIHLFL